MSGAGLLQNTDRGYLVLATSLKFRTQAGCETQSLSGLSLLYPGQGQDAKRSTAYYS